MPVSRDQREIVFQGQRSNPKVCIGDGRAGASELDEQPCPLFCCLAAGEQDVDCFLGQESLQGNFVSVPLVPAVEPSLDLRQ